MRKLFFILIFIQFSLISCLQSSNQNSKFIKFYYENLSKLDSIIVYLDSNQNFSNLFGKELSSVQVNYYLLSELGIDSIYFISGGCNRQIRQKQYIFTFSKGEFKDIVFSKNRCAGFISRTGAHYKNLDEGVITEGLGMGWFFWER